MNVLLINPNTYHSPPVIPLGLEYIAAALQSNHHQVDLLDLCFSPSPLQDTLKWMETHTYQLIGITIRNVDTVLFQNNEFFLDAIKELVDSLQRFAIPVVLGGSGFSISPKEILSYCGATYGVLGPGEKAIVKLANTLSKSSSSNILIQNPIIDGKEFGFDPDIVPQRGVLIDYPKYVAQGGIIGFETQKGCYNHCSYCVEAKTGMFFKKSEKIIQELQQLIAQGYHDLHLCDSEFNMVLSRSERFLKILIHHQLPLRWAAYLAPVPYDENLFRLLKESGVYLITLSVCSDPREMQEMGYTYADLENILNLCQTNQLKVAIDLLIGFPGEADTSIIQMLQFFKTHRPQSVGINFYFRLYTRTTLGFRLKTDPKYQSYLSRPLQPEDDMLSPIFYHHLTLEQVNEWIAQDPLFKIEGFEKTVNYQRI